MSPTAALPFSIWVGGRQTGKTSAMLEWMEQASEGEHRVCVSFSREEAKRLCWLARREGRSLEGWQFLDVDEIIAESRGRAILAGRGGRVVLGLDNLEMILPRLLGREVGLCTATVEKFG